MTIEEKLSAMGIKLEKGPANDPNLKILMCKQSGNLLYVSGQGSKTHGKVGRDLTTEQGRAAARESVIDGLQVIYRWTGDLSKVRSIVKLLGFVNSDPDFTEQPAVVNGGTELLSELSGKEIGMHARSAIGVASLPAGSAVEIEMIVELEA